MSGIFRCARIISKNYRIANPSKGPFISSASPVHARPLPPPHYSTTTSPPPTTAGVTSNKFKFDEKDLASEESLRGLYERWMRHHKVSRSGEEKERRFKVFKEMARYIHKFNKRETSVKLGLNQFADTSQEDKDCMYRHTQELRRRDRYDRLNGIGHYQYLHIEKVDGIGKVFSARAMPLQGGKDDGLGNLGGCCCD